ncbi:MAG: phosphoribosylglycinamide formyltransferase [Actinomycetota bacterium]|nr:phosphoribosylglycinamide formyltransferase [Actinomycetota bacterium]
MRPVPDSFRIVVLASGGGTNLQAIIDQLHGQGRVEVVGVGSDQADAFALERARAAGIDTGVFTRKQHGDRLNRDLAMADWIDSRSADLVVLAGYMQLVSPEFVGRFRGRIINVHPALLPSFPGLDAIGQAVEHGVRVTGVTVHFVDEGTDTGPIILQRAVEVPADWDREQLENAVHEIEHQIYPEAIGMISEGRVRIADDSPRQVIIDQ